MSPRTRRVLLASGLSTLTVAIGLQVAVPAHHGSGWREVWFHGVPGFQAILGFAGCWAIVMVAKGFGKRWLQRPEDYYGEADPTTDEVAPPLPGVGRHD